MFQKKSAFTLVELIVVITILSILGTIAFVSLGGYAVLARESARIADINTITKSLNIYYTSNDRYPDTASGVEVSYSGSELWTHGYFTDAVRSQLKNISESPLDPILGISYIYSVTYNNQEFQLAGASERGSPIAFRPMIPETHASFSKALVKGNYNGAILAKNINENIYVFGVPSIVTNAVTSADIQDIYQNRGFIVNGFGSLPQGFSTDGVVTGNLEFPSSGTVVDGTTALLYQGTKEALSTHSTLLTLSQDIYDLYSVTPLTALEALEPFVSINPTTYTTTETQVPVTVQTAQYLLSARSTAPVLETPALVTLSQNTSQNTATSGNGGNTPTAPTDPACYSAGNLGTIGQSGWTGCEGMLIVSTALLMAAGSSWTNGGDDSFAILGPNALTYTFADGPNKIFTGQVTNLDYLFQFSTFNGDIAYWDTSNVTSMLRTFEFAQAFNQPIGSWDTSSVTNMSHTFHWAQNFNQPLNTWDVSNVTDMSILFNYAQAFNQPLDSWDVTSVTNMQFLFRGTSFNQNINSWNVSNVTNMREVFSGNIAFNQPLNSWNVSSATNMNGTFNEARSFNQDISTWDVSSAVDMTYMFTEANVFNQDLSSWCVSSITSFPTEFDTNTTAWVKTARQPVWGTCP